MTIWNLRGTPAQNALVERALALSDFPDEVMAPSLHGEGRSAIDVDWADLSARGAVARSGGAGHAHEDGVHTVEREVDGRSRVLGLFYLPPYTRVVLDVSLEQHPDLAVEVFLAEAAHAVDYHWMVPKGLRRAVWNILHGTPSATGEIAESGDVDHGHSWFDGPAGYASWAGEAVMEAVTEAFAPGVRVTIQLDHPVSPEMAAQVRAALLAPLGPAPKRVFRGTRRTVFHDEHRSVTPVEWYPSAAEATAAGLRPCRTCRPS